MRELYESMNGKQPGDPAKLAQALLTIADQEQPPFRFIAGADAIAQAEAKLAERQQQIDAYRDLSTSLALDEASSAGAKTSAVAKHSPSIANSTNTSTLTFLPL